MLEGPRLHASKRPSALQVTCPQVGALVLGRLHHSLLIAAYRMQSYASPVTAACKE